MMRTYLDKLMNNKEFKEKFKKEYIKIEKREIMLQYIKLLEESNDINYINTKLKKGWVLLKIVSLEKEFLYVIGLPNFVE